MSWGMEMAEIRSEQKARGIITGILDPEISRLKQQSNELRGALERLLAKPRCGACRRAVRLTLDRIKVEQL